MCSMRLRVRTGRGFGQGPALLLGLVMWACAVGTGSGEGDGSVADDVGDGAAPHSEASTKDARPGDSDRDGIPDAEDNCPNMPNQNQADTDGDGKGDVCDDDLDGDGVPNADDNCRNVPNADQADSDGDGVGDACETDRDGDGVDDTQDNCPDKPNHDQADMDGDGIGDVCDDDADGDGYTMSEGDCADLDPDRNPGAEELCNNIDDDCDGNTDPPADAWEPNDDPSTAKHVGNVDDTGGWIHVRGANLSPLGDEDWYRFHDNDRWNGQIYPEVKLTSNPGNFTVCAYYDCDDNGGLSSLGCSGTNVSRVSDGPPNAPEGCCGRANLKLDPDCSGSDDSGNIYVVVFSETGDSCESYDLTLGDE